MNVTSREEMIHDRLIRYLIEDLGAAASPMDRSKWDEYSADLGPSARFGVSWPVPYTSEHPFTVGFQPQVLAEVTAELSDEDLSDFLDAIETLIAIQISHLCDGLDRHEAISRAAEEMTDSMPGSMWLLVEADIEAQMQAHAPSLVSDFERWLQSQ